MMKRLLIALLVTVLGVSMTSVQGQDKADLEQKYKKKLEKEFVSKVPWVMTMEKAKKLSKEQKKPILAYFTRSYAP